MHTHVITNLAVIAIRTSTVEFVHGFVDEIRPAGSTVLTSIALAADQFHRTVFTSIFWFTSTKIVRSTVGADTMLTRVISFTFVDLVLTVITLVTFIAFTCIATNTIHTGASLARIAVTLVDIHLTILAGDSLYA